MADFVIYPAPQLSLAAVPRPVDARMLAVGEALQVAAAEVQAYGLAAAHIGHIEPVVVLSMAGQAAERDYRVLYNPQVVASAPETVFAPEGSVSMPGIELPIERPIWAEVTWNSADGSRETARFECFVARVALHEIDQMNGVFFLARISRLKRDTAIRKFNKSRR